jgi:putative oxidoreductase
MKPEASGSLEAAGLAAGRLLLAALFILEGWNKLRGYDTATAYMDRYGVPGALLPAVIALELGAGLMIAVGWQTRLAALALSLFCVLAAVLFHGNISDRGQVLHFEKDLTIAGGLLVLAVAGAGRWSFDGRLQRAGPRGAP